MDETRYIVNIIELFDGKLSHSEIMEMDVAYLNSLIEAKIEQLEEKEEKYKNLSRNSKI